MEEWNCSYINSFGLNSSFDIHKGTINERLFLGVKDVREDNFIYENAYKHSIDSDGKTILEKSWRHYYFVYQGFLDECIREFKEEIEDNMLSSNQITKQEYITQLFIDLKDILDKSESNLIYLEKNKPQIEDLPDEFILYLKAKNLDVNKLHELEIGEQCKLYVNSKTMDINERMESEVAKYSSYYSYLGINEKIINTSQINIEKITEFKDEFLRKKYSFYLKDFYMNENPTVKKLDKKKHNPTHSFKFNKSSQLEQITEIFDKLKFNDKGITYVDENVRLVDFKKLFNNIEISKLKPIFWKGSNASLRYFIKKFPFDLTNEVRFKTTFYCFDFENKKDYTQIENAKQLSVKDEKMIDSIFNHYHTSK